MHGNLTILGPQNPDANLPAVLRELGATGPIAVINAGWRLDETDTSTLEDLIEQPALPLPLYHWYEEAMEHDPALKEQYRTRSAHIISYKELYRLRMNAGLRVVHQLMDRESELPRLVGMELVRAMDHVREIDEQLLASIRDIRASFQRLEHARERGLVAERRRQAERTLKEANTLLIAGGHVAVLLNRLRLFGVGPLIEAFLAQGKPVVCWSAGAMVMSPRVVLFYDDPPEGPSEAEILDNGLGLLPDAVLLPHAQRRLRLEDTGRVARLAKRFAPAPCIGLENGAWLVHHRGSWHNRGAQDAAFHLDIDGQVRPLRTP